MKTFESIKVFFNVTSFKSYVFYYSQNTTKLYHQTAFQRFYTHCLAVQFCYSTLLSFIKILYRGNIMEAFAMS